MLPPRIEVRFSYMSDSHYSHSSFGAGWADGEDGMVVVGPFGSYDGPGAAGVGCVGRGARPSAARPPLRPRLLRPPFGRRVSRKASSSPLWSMTSPGPPTTTSYGSPPAGVVSLTSPGPER